MSHLLPDQLRLMAEALPDEIGFTNVAAGCPEADRHLTFSAWERRSNQLARWMVAQGVEPGDRVAIHVPPEEPDVFLLSYSATHKAGAVAVPTSTRLVARELGYVLAHAGAVLAISGASSTPALVVATADLPALRRVVTTGPTDIAPDLTAWADATDPDDGAFQVPVESDAMADLMYTSGTTGRPKGVVVRHRNVAMMPNGLPKWSGRGWLHASPMFTFAGIASTYNPMKLGMCLMYLPRFDVDRWFDVVEELRPRGTFIVPAMAELLIASPRFDAADLSSIRICAMGSAPVAPGTIARLQERVPNALVSNSWGMTEAGPAFCSMPPDEHAKRVGSVGRPVPPTEFRIVDPDGDLAVDLAPREIGELLVRNGGREREYFNDAEATASTWRDGWLHSGDLAYLDEDGFLYIVGRQKDVIIRGGNNVHATDVESVLFEHPGVQEVAVAGVPHPVLGEDIGAWVVLVPGTEVTVDELQAFCEERLTDYKRPRRITFVDELPRNATGKVVKLELPGSMTAPIALQDLDVERAGFYLRDDYFELLAWLRANDPVHRSANGMLLVTRYEEIREISRDPARFTSRRGALVNDPLRMVEPNDAAGSLLHLDPPLHADYRKLLNREFTPRATAKMETTVRRIVTDAFDAAAAAGDVVDFVEHVALPIPVAVIADLLGMGDQDMADVRRWSDATIAITDDQSEDVLTSVMEFVGFLDGHVQQRFDAAAAGTPGDDLLSLLAGSQVGDVPLTTAQVQLFCMTLMVAGNETTRSLVSGGALALAEHPDQRATLISQPDLLPGAVEECLRWVTPIQAFCRTAVGDLEVAGSPVSDGDYLVLLYASGNRDEAVFGPTADRFDLARPATPAHVAFGFGEHLCLGASLARMEARIVFEELLRRHPTYEVAGEPVFVASTLTRSLESLPVRLG